MIKTGTLLKDKRESINLSLSEVALATKINPKILTAIEKGEEANLPAKTFLKGFIRSYALFLKMDVEEVLRTFQEETGGPPAERVHEAYSKTETPQGTPASRRRVGEENSSGLRTAAVVVIVLLIGLIIGVRELIEKYQREKVVSADIKVTPLAQPAATDGTSTAKPDEKTSTTPTPTTPSPMIPAASAPNPVTVTPPPAPVPVVTEVKAPEPKPVVEKPVAEKKPEEKKPPEKKPEPTTEAKATAATDAKPETPPTGVKGMKNEIILEALDKVDVKFQVKGETKLLSLAPTQVHTIHSNHSVVLDLSDGGAVNIIVNGRDQGPPGTLGQPKQIKIP